MKNSKLVIASIVIASALLTGCSSTDRVKTDRYYVDARVNQVDVAPEICSSNSTRGARSLGGAIIGGAIGNQIGSGNGKKAATVLGVVLGANAGRKANPRGGDKLKCSRNGYIANVSYMSPSTNVMRTEWVRMQRKTRAKMINVPVCVTGASTYVCL